MAASEDYKLFTLDDAMTHLRKWLINNDRKEESHSLRFWENITAGATFIGWRFRTDKHEFDVTRFAVISERAIPS